MFGTDAVAGAHGRNAEELVYRVRDFEEFRRSFVVDTARAYLNLLAAQQARDAIAQRFDSTYSTCY